MPLFELVGAAKGKSSSIHEKPIAASADLSFTPENELVELIWENGQIMMQGQSSRVEKSSSFYGSYGITPFSLPSYSLRKELGLSSGPLAGSSGKFKTLESGLTEFPMSVPLEEMCLSSDDDIAPWFDCGIDEPLRNDYCSTFLPELSGVTANEPSLNNFDPMKGGGCNNRVYRDSDINPMQDSSSLDQGSSLKSSSLAVVSEAMRPGASLSPAGQTQFLTVKPREVYGKTGTSTSNHCVSMDSSGVTNSGVEFPCEKSRKQNPGASVDRNEFLNFSHFSRPAVLYKSTIGNNRVVADSGPSNLERASLKHMDSTPDEKTVGPMREATSLGQFVEEKQATDSRSSEPKPTEEPPPKESVGTRQECAPEDDKQSNQRGGASMSKELQEPVEPVVASSVCSGNGVDSVSNDAPRNLKRKDRSNYDSEERSEDIEEDSVGLRKSGFARGGGSKRGRAAEVHNLSERRRRDRINEKMRALQELIPNCNKVDKASMLDEAIEYLKTLQLQVQIMSMGAGLCMPPMMLLPPHMAQFSPMGVGMPTGLGFGMQGAHFPTPIMPGHPALPGMTGPVFPIMALPGQGLPMSMQPAPPLVPLRSWGQHMQDGAVTSTTAPKDDTGPSTAAASEEKPV